MGFTFYCLLFCFLFLTSPLFAEETIKVLIIENPNHPLPTGNAENLGNIKGDILIDNRIYYGLITVRKDTNGLYFIIDLPFEKYVEDVVAAETGKDWADEALKAQAVVSRTYALYQKNLNSGKDYHLTSSVLHQSYMGDNKDERIRRAVKETRGEILTYEGKPIEAFYHSSCTGNTALPEEVWDRKYPYFKSVPCKGKDSPYSHWHRRFTIREMEKALGLTGIKDIKILSFTSTGRVNILQISAAGTEIEINAVHLRKTLGYKELPSTLFSITIEGDNVFFEGGGYGHGVGLSQWGALELANEGKTYKEILEYYYPGTILEKQ